MFERTQTILDNDCSYQTTVFCWSPRMTCNAPVITEEIMNKMKHLSKAGK